MSNYIYMAGLMDGEGSIMLSRVQSNQNRTPVLSITMTTESIIRWLQDTFGGTVSVKKTYKEHHKPAWVWKLTKQADVFHVLDSILPYMKEPQKVARGNYILDHYLSVTVRNGKYNAEQKESKLAFEANFLLL